MREEHGNLEQPLFVQEHTGKGAIFAVFDGVGGECFGETASFMGSAEIDAIMASTDRIKKEPMFFLKEACERMHQTIRDEGIRRRAYGMGSTLALLYFLEGSAFVCNVGDSGVFRIRQGRIEELYEEHTNRKFLKAHGIALRKPELTQYLGMEDEDFVIQPYIHETNVRKDDIYLICSDGLTDAVARERILEILSVEESTASATLALMQEAIKNKIRDNVTVILCKVIVE